MSKTAKGDDVAALQAAQQVARKARLGMWQYGDADSDEEEPVRGAWGRGR